MKQKRCNFHLILLLFIIALFMVVPVSATGVPAGKPDPDFYVDIYQPDKVWPGTTLFADYHTPNKARVVEVNMQGEIVWQYVLPGDLQQFTSPGFDVELLPNTNILMLLPNKGVYEIDRKGTIVWSYPDSKVSHDADRLPNGNTLINFGNNDGKDDAQVKEVNPRGEVVWSWHAKDSFDKPPYNTIYKQGWTHSNAVTRLPSGNTLVSLRNFNLTVEVNPQGTVVWQYDWSSIGTDPHEPEILPGGNILVSFPAVPDEAVELNPRTGQVVWRYVIQKSEPRIGSNRDADRLPNGNTLINDGIKLLEVTPAGEIVWQFTVRGLDRVPPQQRLSVYLFKSERIGMQAPKFSIVNPRGGVCSPKETEISIQYVDTDLALVWYRVFDRTKKTWATENITYLRNKWANAITFEGKETGQPKINLEEGDYTLYVWAASTGWGDENLNTPKVINTAESKVNFSVTANCAAIQPVSSPPVSSTTLSGTSPPGIITEKSTAAPLSWAITLFGIIVVGCIVKMQKNRTGKS